MLVVNLALPDRQDSPAGSFEFVVYLSVARDPNMLPSGKQTVQSLTGSVPSDFGARFKTAFGRAPGQGAQDGYRAMAAIIAAIKTAGAAGTDRTRVIDSY